MFLLQRKRINIESIVIIVKKKEKECFSFSNPRRIYDGFVLFTEGCGDIILENDSEKKRYHLQKGSLFLFKQNDKYTIYSEKSGEYITSGFLFAKKHYEEINKLPRLIETDNRLFNTISEMADIWQSRSWDSYIICKIKLLQMYLSIMEKQQRNSILKDADVSMAVDFIHSNFKRNFTTLELANHCALSPSYLRTKFIKKTGKTITQFRDSLRISAAKEMLRVGDFSINEISAELGYYDVSHFSKFFLKHVGETPSNFIERNGRK